MPYVFQGIPYKLIAYGFRPMAFVLPMAYGGRSALMAYGNVKAYG